jgi:hypothetical protein
VALTKFPADITPDYCFMNRRMLELRRRTHITSPTGIPTLPEIVDGIPIVITDSIVNTEA